MKRFVKVGAGLTALFAIQLANPTSDTFAQKKSNEIANIIEERLEGNEEKTTAVETTASPITNIQEEEITVEGESFIPKEIQGVPGILEEEEEEEVIILPEGSDDFEEEDGGVVLPEIEDKEPALPTPEEEEHVDEEVPTEVDTPSINEEEDGGYIVPPLEEDGAIDGETPLLPENPNEATEVESIWTMDGRVLKAYKNGQVEYEFAFRHNPIIGVDNVDLEDAVFYLNLPEGASFQSATFGGKYDAENHRVFWLNPGGIPTSHANFDPFTPRRVNVQLFFEQPEGEKVATAYATYLPKGGKELVTNTVTIEHGFDQEAPVLAEGIEIKGELAERPGVPSSFPILSGERFTYDVSYSMKTDTPYREAELIVQLSDQLKFDKHVQLTGDFKTYYYDADKHRFVFVFKPEILEAQGVMKINNLYFPNYYTEPGTEGMIQMFLQYNENETVAINPDVLNAYAEADWKVTTAVDSEVDPVVNTPVTYVIQAKNKSPREEGSLALEEIEVVHQLAKEAIFKDAYTLVNGERIAGTYDQAAHAVTFRLKDVVEQQQLFYIDALYTKPSENVVHKTILSYKPLNEEVESVDIQYKHPVYDKEEGNGGSVEPEEKPSTGGCGGSTEPEEKPEEKPSTGGGGGSTEPEEKPEEKPSTGGEGENTEPEEKPEEKPSTGGGGGSTEPEEKPEEKPSTGGGGGSTEPEEKPEEKPSTGGGGGSTEPEEKPEEKPSTGGGGGSTEPEEKPEKPSTGGGGGGGSGWIAPEDILNPDKEKPETDGDGDSEVEEKPEETPETDGDGNSEVEEKPEETPETDGEGNSEGEENPEESPVDSDQSVEKPTTPVVPGQPSERPNVQAPQETTPQQNEVVEHKASQKEGQLPQTNERVSMWAWLSGLLAMLAGFVLYFRPSNKRSDEK